MIALAKLRDGQKVELSFEEAERAALAERLGLLALDRLEATLTLHRSGERIRAEGFLRAAVTQACVASGEPVPAIIDEKLVLLFAPEPTVEPDAELELSAEDLDVIFHDGREIDFAAAVADELSLTLDPYPRSASAEKALKAAGVLSEEQAGPFAALAALKK